MLNDATVTQREWHSELCTALVNKSAKVGVIGLGYVGVPLALAAIGAGFQVLGFDANPDRVSELNAGRSFIRHIPDAELRAAVSGGRFEATADLDRLDEPDAILICVPTPLTRNREPDLTFVEATTHAIRKRLRRGQLIVLESTTYPGTTTEVMRPILELSGLRSEADFFLAYSPEREDPGNPSFTTSVIPKVVGGDGPSALRAALLLYDHIVVSTIPVSSPSAAEAVKLTENIFRSVNIALVNELKVVYTALGIDIWEVIEAAKTKPFGFMPFYPGPGLGGHCIPIDPFYLTWKAREVEIPTRFIELAGEINTRMPYLVVDALTASLSKNQKKSLNGSNVLILGASYKRNVDDTRESPSLKLIELLEDRGAVCAFHDPFVSVLPLTREHPRLAGRESTALSPSSIESFDAILVATDHDGVDYQMVANHARLLVDTRNVIARHGLTCSNLVKA